MGDCEKVFGPFIADHPEHKYLIDLCCAIDSGKLNARIDIISAAILGGKTLPADVAAYF